MTGSTMELPLELPPRHSTPDPASVLSELSHFQEFGNRSLVSTLTIARPGQPDLVVPTVTNEFWTSRQRAANALHEISYRACFKPQLPRFFMERLTRPGDRVHDPFMGRGTTLMEAALRGRVPVGSDINPLSLSLVRPRLAPPTLEAIRARLEGIDFTRGTDHPKDLLVFFHPDTLRQLTALRRTLNNPKHGPDAGPELDPVDDWINMVALNRLTGHSSGFFSVYTLPPNQAVSVDSQRKINRKRQQVPPVRDVPGLILRKSRSLLADCQAAEREILESVAGQALLLNAPASETPEIVDDSIQLVVTSPPFLDVVNYASDNWLRCWYLGIDPHEVAITVPRRTEEWEASMTAALREIHRVLQPGGYAAFEVGEVRKGRLKLEEVVLPCGDAAGLEPCLVLINDQQFTKTANCWGVANNRKGTNTNRVVLFRKR